MISSGEVGAVLTVVDQASAVLKTVADQFINLDKIIKSTKEQLSTLTMPPRLVAQLKAMNEQLDAMSGAAEKGSGAATAAFAELDKSINASIDRVGVLKGEMASLGTGAGVRTAEGGALTGLRGRGTGGRGGGGIGHVAASVPLAGGAHARFGMGPAMIAGGAVAYGAFEEAEVQDFINKIFLTGQISTGLQSENPLAKQIREAIVKTYVMTGLPLKQIEEGILTGTRGLAGIPLEKRLALMPGLLAASATEAYLKEGTTVPEAMQAFVGLAHMEGKYKPEEIAKLAEHFAFLSTTTPVSVEQVERAAGYAIPMLRTANFDPEQLLLMITSMERAGIMNTKAGTWISQLATQSFPGTSLMSKMLFAKHEGALKDLGLIDDKHQPTWFTDGRPDLVKMTGIAGEHIAAMDPAHRLAVEKALWGQQGGRAAGFFADPTNRAIMQAVAGEEPNFIAGEKMWQQSLQNSPMVQFRTSFAGLNVELMNLGANVLPFVTGALKKANDVLGGKGELAALGGGLLAWMFRGSVAPWLGRGISLLGGVPGLAAGAVGAGVYAASQLSSPEGIRATLAAPDPGYAARKRLNDILNPASIPTGELMDPSIRARATMMGIGTMIKGEIDRIPGQVQPSITHMASTLSGALSNAIGGIANAAAGAIRGPAASKPIVVHTALNIDGQAISQQVTRQQIAAGEIPSNTGRFDGSEMFTSTDYAVT